MGKLCLPLEIIEIYVDPTERPDDLTAAEQQRLRKLRQYSDFGSESNTGTSTGHTEDEKPFDLVVQLNGRGTRVTTLVPDTRSFTSLVRCIVVGICGWWHTS